MYKRGKIDFGDVVCVFDVQSVLHIGHHREELDIELEGKKLT